jgi:hypothetical protein
MEAEAGRSEACCSVSLEYLGIFKLMTDPVSKAQGGPHLRSHSLACPLANTHTHTHTHTERERERGERGREGGERGKKGGREGERERLLLVFPQEMQSSLKA